MKKILIYSILFTLLSLQAMAQLKISGKVTNAQDNSPLPAVSIRIKGTSTGTVTDANGNYSITAPNANAVLVFTYTGFAAQEVSVAGKTSY
jgi:hypothetical protein